MPKYLVEAISMFRMRYVVECNNMDDAKAAVLKDEANEFSQKHIAENIINCREMADEEISEMFFDDNPHLRTWVPGKALEFVYKVTYDK